MNYTDALNKLCKWRSLLAGWVAGTRDLNSPGVQGLRDMQDARLITRVELTALSRVLIEKKIITLEEWERVVTIEALELDKLYEKKFPGFSTDQDGLHIKMPEAAETMAKYDFPP